MSASGWFRDTFDPQYARSEIGSALARSIVDVIADISHILAPPIRAELTHADKDLEKAKILFNYLDEQVGNAALVRAFQLAVASRGGVGYLLNDNLNHLFGQGTSLKLGSKCFGATSTGTLSITQNNAFPHPSAIHRRAKRQMFYGCMVPRVPASLQSRRRWPSWSASGNLTAAFFFARWRNGGGDGAKLFPTLAYQFALCSPALKKLISRAMEEDPSICDKTLEEQARV
ncbi:hypothetical protein C8F01DRAFT_1372532 [Mycena amicta]|nr:hypothetical protein C8F01DRAFT_1372532 [Mycena amicta]